MIQNKHIIRLSFIGLFLNIIANIILYRYFMIEEVILKQAFDNNAYLVKTYQKEVWNNNQLRSKSLGNDYDDNLLTNPEYIKFIKDSMRFLSNVNSVINIYDRSGKKILSNNIDSYENLIKHSNYDLYNIVLNLLDGFFLNKYLKDNPIESAYKGETSHLLISNAKIVDEYGHYVNKSMVSSYIPIISAKGGKFSVDGVIEISTDITDQWKNITFLEKRAIIIFIVIFMVFFIVVMYNTNYAQRIINKQFETNRALKEAKIKAETESSAKTEFLANVSHELRTPLNAIIGFSEIIMAETYGDIQNKQYKDYINDINNSGKHLLSVINDILDFSKAAADKLKVETVELDLHKISSSSLRFVKPRAEAADIKLIEDFPEGHVVIVADPKRLKQALLNLLSNSVKFTPSGGTVTLSIVVNNFKKQVKIIVTDNGIGMDDSQIPKALSSFGQVDNKLSRKYEGTGLGLPLTKKLIELMNGKFKLESQKNKGTKVTITFKYDNEIQF